MLPHRICTLNSCRVFTRAFRSSVLNKEPKTPIQEWGWAYLKRQEALRRPISPHLSIYKPQVTWIVSGFHRITGCVMAGALLVGGIGFAVLPIDFTTFVEYIRGLELPRIVLGAFKLLIAYPIVFHTLNGIRFLGYDMAKGMDLKTIHFTGWTVVGVSLLISLIIVLCSGKESPRKDNK